MCFPWFAGGMFTAVGEAESLSPILCRRDFACARRPVYPHVVLARAAQTRAVTWRLCYVEPGGSNLFQHTLSRMHCPRPPFEVCVVVVVPLFACHGSCGDCCHPLLSADCRLAPFVVRACPGAIIYCTTPGRCCCADLFVGCASAATSWAGAMWLLLG